MNTNHNTQNNTDMNGFFKKAAPEARSCQRSRMKAAVHDNTNAVIAYDHTSKLEDTSFVTAEVFCCGTVNDAGNFLRDNEAAFTMFSGALMRGSMLMNDDGEEEWWFSIEDVACALGLYEVYGRKSMEMVADATDVDQQKTVLFGKNNKKMKVVSVSGFFAALLKYSDRTEAGQRFMRWVTRTLLPALFEGCSYDITIPFDVCGLNCLEIWDVK